MYVWMILSFSVDCVSSTDMRCLAHFLNTKNKKKKITCRTTSADTDIPFLVIEATVRIISACVHAWINALIIFYMQRGTPEQEAIDV